MKLIVGPNTENYGLGYRVLSNSASNKVLPGQQLHVQS